LGTGARETWDNVVAGKSGIGPITRFETKDFTTRIAGEIKNFDSDRFIDKKEKKKMDLFIQYALAASILAVEDSGLEIRDGLADRTGVLIGVGMGGLPSIEAYHDVYRNSGPRRISPFFIPMVIPNLAAGQVSIHFGIRGPNSCTVTACAAGTHAIGDAWRIIERGEADVMIVGGAESVISPLAVGGFGASRALSTRNDEPTKASRPFDRNRDGFVISEGSGIIVLEELEHAKKRGAKIYAELIGYGMSGDGYNIVAPPPDGSGAVRCMKQALKSARIPPERVDYINAHATSTMADVIESNAIKQTFGNHSHKLAISSTKSCTGHLLGAAGGVEAIFSILTIVNGLIPPTINLEDPDDGCDLDYVPNQARETPVRVAMSNSFGFGGTNATVVFQRFE
jgi:3-oxoacyl-[acyl-carrier-protein] synthase II